MVLAALINSKMETHHTYNESGHFTYEPSGFIYKTDKQASKVKWLEIESIIAYKVDLLTIDEIRIDVFYNNTRLIITEEITGWEGFIKKIKMIFPDIPIDWYSQVVRPPFTTNRTTLYKKEHYKILADFNNADASGRVRLNTQGSLKDIGKLSDSFKEDMYVLLDDDEELAIFGKVKYSGEENIWVAEVDWNNFIEK